MSKLILGCGYLGQRLAACWRGSGERVFATTRKPARLDELRQLGLEPLLCDVLDLSSLLLLPTVDTLVHCTALDRQSTVSMRQLYVDGLANVLASLPSTTRIVHVSSTSVYAQTAGEDVDEAALTEPVEGPGQVVLEAERLLRQRRPDAIVLRFAGIYGPGRLIRARDLQAGRLLAIDPDKWLNLIHVEDGARAIVAACERGELGMVYNVSDGTPVRRRDFYTTLAELLHADPPRFVPPPEPIPAGETVNRRINNTRMRSRLGVMPNYPSYREGLLSSL